jgi:hypothetical protein
MAKIMPSVKRPPKKAATIINIALFVGFGDKG